MTERTVRPGGLAPEAAVPPAGSTAYDDRAEAIHPGPTVAALCSGTAAGIGISIGLTTLVAATSSAAWAWAAVVIGPLCAWIWTGLSTRRHPARQGAWAGGVIGVWAALATAVPAGISLPQAMLSKAAARGESTPEAAELLLSWADAHGTLGALGVAVAAPAIGAALGAIVASLAGRRRRPRHGEVLDPLLLETGLRVVAILFALGALAFGWVLYAEPPVAPGPAPDGALSWARPDASWLAWELAMHGAAVALVIAVVRAVWRLPRTAPETAVRATVDGLVLSALVAGLLTARLTIGGPWHAWVVPALPWGAGLLALALTGRPAPPPRPPRGAVSMAQALAFSGLVVAALLAATCLWVWPTLPSALGVAPWSASLRDATADRPDAVALAAPTADVVWSVLRGVLALWLGMAVAAWSVRRVTSRWVGAPTPA